MRADFLRALLHRIGHQAVDTDRRERQCDTRENREQRHIEIVSRSGFADDVLHTAEMSHRESPAASRNSR